MTPLESGAPPGPRVTLRRDLAATYAAEGPDAAGPVLRQLCLAQGWGHAVTTPLAAVIRPGSRVLVKPNWVLHANQGPWGIEPLITHASLIQAMVEAALDSGAGRVVVADAPVQGCNFEALLEATGIGAWAEELARREPRFGGAIDLRRTIRVQGDAADRSREGVRDPSHFCLFDLGKDSLIEPITTAEPRFRVTQYHPDHLARTHAPGRHQYLVSREVMEADLVINFPKLKTHKKAGVTCALKNLVGINGNKEYLPHHRLGGSAEGGDCYPGSDPVKRTLEWVFDRFNAARQPLLRRGWRSLTRVLSAIQHRRGDDIGVEGAWSGNDTVWRMCLDLNRILLHGTPESTLADQPMRRVIHLADGIVAGQGDGPLRAEPLGLGVLVAGDSGAAVDWIGSVLLGYAPDRIPIVRHAFDHFRWPITGFDSGAIEVRDAVTGRPLDQASLEQMTPAGVHYPEGWLNAVRRTG